MRVSIGKIVAILLGLIVVTILTIAAGALFFFFFLWGPEVRHAAHETFERTFHTTDAPQVSVESFGGDLEVTVGNPGVVEVRIIKTITHSDQAIASSFLRRIHVSAEAMPTLEAKTIRVRAMRPEECPGPVAANISVKVPPRSQVEITGGGYIRLLGPVGDVAVRGGGVGILVDGAEGELLLATTLGGVYVKGGKGRVNAQSEWGNIELKADGIVVDACTANEGKIDFTGRLAEGVHRFRAEDGTIVLTLPSDSNFHVHAESRGGEVNCEFPMIPVTPGKRGTLHGAVGSDAGVTVHLQTSKGSILIRETR